MNSNERLLLHLYPLMKSNLKWVSTGSANALRAATMLRDEDGHAIQWLNLVTACAAHYGRVYHSADYHTAARAAIIPDTIAMATIMAGDGILPESHEHFVTLSKVVKFLRNGGNLLNP